MMLPILIYILISRKISQSIMASVYNRHIYRGGAKVHLRPFFFFFFWFLRCIRICFVHDCVCEIFLREHEKT